MRASVVVPRPHVSGAAARALLGVWHQVHEDVRATVRYMHLYDRPRTDDALRAAMAW